MIFAIKMTNRSFIYIQFCNSFLFDKKLIFPKDKNLFKSLLILDSFYKRIDNLLINFQIFYKQLEVLSRPIPWKAIILALFLFIVGSVIIIMSCLIFTGYIVNIKPTDGLLVLLLLGFVMFIPGFYHCRIAYYAYHKYPGL